MPIYKTNTVISDNISLAAGGGPTTTSSVATTAGWHKMVHIKLTNGASAPSVVANAEIQGSPDNVNFYTVQKSFLGSAFSAGELSYTFLVLAAVQYVRVVWTHGPDGDPVTARAELSEIAEIAESVSDETGESIVFTGDTATNAERVNVVKNTINTITDYNQITVDMIAVNLPDAVASKGVIVKALNGNTGIVYVGDSNAVTSATGFELGAGEALSLPVSNANLVWLIGSDNGQIVSWMAL